MDRINRATWSEPATVAWFQTLEGHTDPGERAALSRVVDEAKGGAILDLGVGAGRTVPLLRAISEHYTAIDYTPALVAACKQKYPQVDVSVGDARDLSRFADETFELVVFSFNGLDAVNVSDRARVLREVARVLKKGGSFVFSTHNRGGPGHGEKLSLGVHHTRNPFRLLARVVRALVHLGDIVHNQSENARLNYLGDGYSIMNPAAHDHGLLVYYATLRKQMQDLAEAGFAPRPLIFGNLTERQIVAGEDTSHIWWFHFVARR